MLTMSAASITVTGVLGIVLVLTWARERESVFVGWWGLALLMQSAGIVISAASSLQNDADLVTIGTAAMVLSDAVKWHAARQFANHPVNPAWTLLGPLVFLMAAYSGYLDGFGARLVVVCTLSALYNFAAAFELSRANGEYLASRWPAVGLLVVTGLSCLSWLPLNLIMPTHEVIAVFSSTWFPAVILATLLVRIALAFVVLSMAKERQEMEQRTDALTDPLTGLPNRRALFEAADAYGHERSVLGGPISVLIFDLDHFKQVNDRFGHAQGDRVLRLFAIKSKEHLNGNSIVARLGGEEFAAILPGADARAAVGCAEAVRHAFAKSAAFVDGLPVGATVSVGAASDSDLNSDLNALFRRADAALYVAKRGGRDRVEYLAPEDTSPPPAVGGVVRANLDRRSAAPPAVVPVTAYAEAKLGV
ncbi:MAG: GGDEF domain-containing protein [Actinomycetota bacterium]